MRYICKRVTIQESILLVDNKDDYKSQYTKYGGCKGDGFVALVDSGFEDSVVSMLNALQSIDISPEQITHIILAHAHREYIGSISIGDKNLY